MIKTIKRHSSPEYNMDVKSQECRTSQHDVPLAVYDNNSSSITCITSAKQFVLNGNQDGSLLVWRNHRLDRIFEFKSSIISIVGCDEHIYVQLKSGLIRRLNYFPNLELDEKWQISCGTFSFFPMAIFGDYVLAPSKQDPNQLTIWNLRTPEICKREFFHFHNHLPHIHLIINGEFIVIGFDNGEIQVYDLKTFELISTVNVFDEPVFALCHFKDFIIVGGGTNLIVILSIQGRQIQLVGCKNIISTGVSSIASIGTDFVAVGCWDGRVRILNHEFEEEFALIFHEHSITCLYFATLDCVNPRRIHNISQKVLFTGSQDCNIGVWDFGRI